MSNLSVHWAVQADGKGATLLQIQRHRGESKPVEVAYLSNEWLAPERSKPSSLSSAKTDHGYASEGHVEAEYLRRYAEHLAKWIGDKIHEVGMEKISVCAAPKLQGALRKAYASGTGQRVVEESPHYLLKRKPEQPAPT